MSTATTTKPKRYRYNRIPLKIRKEIAGNPAMQTCIYAGNGCEGRIEWEHAFKYENNRLQEAWAIIPVCTHHHRGGGLDKRYHEYRALQNADLDDIQARLPRFDWKQHFSYLQSLFSNQPMPVSTPKSQSAAPAKNKPSKFTTCTKCGTQSLMFRCSHCGAPLNPKR